jgi:hypothetical protein
MKCKETKGKYKMKTSYAKSFMFTLTFLALVFSGLGVMPAYATTTFTVNPTSWNADVVPINTTVIQTITVTNTSGGVLTGSNLRMLITGSSDFKPQVTSIFCAFQWANNTTCNVYIQFTPSGSGARTANLSIYLIDIYSVDVALSGTGAGPAVSVNPTSWDFGNQTVGVTSGVKSFTLTNSGTQSLTLGTLSVTGTNANNFALSGNNCTNNLTIAAAGTCTFGVTFTPSSTGLKSGSVSIPSNAATATVSLSGTGVNVPQVLERSKNGGVNTYTGTSKVPISWVKSATFATTDGKDITVKKEGIASVKIIGAAGKIKTLTQSITLSGVSGDTFTFTFWAKGASIPTAGICRAQVLLYNGATLMLTKTVACKTGTYATFQKKTLTFNATSAYTKVVIKFTYSKASGTVWFDAVSLLK